MLRRLSVFFLLVSGSCLLLQAQTSGIHVEAPKVYDDYSLKSMLNSAVGSLSTLNPLDMSVISPHIGAIQGGDLTQSQFSLQVGTVPTLSNATTTSNGTNPGLVTTAGTAPDGTATNQTVTTTPNNTYSNVATSGGVSPAQPLAATPSSLTFPTLATSSLDTLNEQMQLSSEITGLRLLLGGSLSDQFFEGTRALKHHVTLGFPISLAPDMGKETENAVAEVEVTVLNGPTPQPIAGTTFVPAPTVTTLLPREKTYNVASIRDKSVSLGVGVVAGMITGGANFFWSHKTYYLIKDQDTVALQKEARKVTNLATGARAWVYGVQGHTTRYYWVLAHFGGDFATAYGPIPVGNSAETLDSTNYVSIDFPYISGALTYDLLTSDKPEFPAPCGRCTAGTVSAPTPVPQISIADMGTTRTLSEGKAPLTTTFAWQFKPVLGQKKVMPGLRQTFVQLAFPTSDNYSCPGSLQVVTRWREYDAKTGTTGKVLLQSEPQEYPISNFDIAPEPSDIETEDVGSGNIRVTIRGSFDKSSRITIGGTTLAGAALELTDHYLKFTASAQLLATNKALLVGEDGSDQEILEFDPIPTGEAHFVGVPPCVSQPLVAPAPSPITITGSADGFLFLSEPIGASVEVDRNEKLVCSETPCRIKLKNGPHTVLAKKNGLSSPEVSFKSQTGDENQSLNISLLQPQIRIRSVAILPFSEKASEILLTLDRVPDDLRASANLNAGGRLVNTNDPLLVTIGNQTYGLRDQPIEITDVLLRGGLVMPAGTATQNDDEHNWVIRLIAPTATLTQAHLITVQRLFYGPYFKTSIDVKAQLDEHFDSEFSISRLDLLSTGDTDKPTSVNVFSVSGSHLDGVTIVSPEGVAPITTIGGTGSQATVGLIRLTGTQMKGLKQLALKKQDGTVAILTIPADAKPTPAKPSITAHAAIDIGATSLDLSGAQLDQVASILYLKTQFIYRLTPDKSKLLVDLPASFTASAGIRILDVTFTDGSTARFPVEIAAKKP